MCLDKGRKPTLSEFRDRVHQRNLDNLTVWQNVGQDIEHGNWAIAGARLGTFKTMLSEWDHTEVQSFDALEQLWKEISKQGAHDMITSTAVALNTQLGLPVNLFDADQSRFFKHHYRSNWHSRGVMVREIDVIRQQEGW
jgi:hypothetical protein